MKANFQVILAIALILYLPIVVMTNFSLTGYWTDVIFTAIMSVILLLSLFKQKTKLYIKIPIFISLFMVLGLIILILQNPFSIDKTKTRSFSFQLVNGRIFHAYFKPVGAYSGGYGNFWITESPVYLPFIERRIYFERAVRYDFNDDSFDGHPIDNYKVVRSYIQEQVIEKGL